MFSLFLSLFACLSVCSLCRRYVEVEIRERGLERMPASPRGMLRISVKMSGRKGKRAGGGGHDAEYAINRKSLVRDCGFVTFIFYLSFAFTVTCHESQDERND